jgi:hypothetical protein
MAWTWIAGYILAGALLWIGLSKRKSDSRASSKQLFVVVGILGLLVMIAWTLDDLFHWWDRFPKEVIGIAGVLMISERCIRITFVRKRKGSTLLDLGRVPVHDMIISLFAGVALAWIAVKDLVEITQRFHWTFQDISLQIFGLSLSFAVLIQGVSKRGLMDRGVFYGTGLSRWEHIESFNWERESTTVSTLVLHKRTTMPVFNLMTLSVKSELAPAVEEVLHQHNITGNGGVPKQER